MSLPSHEAGATVNPMFKSGLSRSAGTRLHGRRRVLVCTVVGVVALCGLIEYLVKLSAFVTQVQTVCTGSSCAYGQLTYTAFEALQRLGLSLGDYAALQITLILLSAVLCLSVAALIVWRKSDDWMALLVVLLLVLWNTGTVTGAFSLGTYTTSQANQFPTPLANLLTRFGFFLVFSLFPNGRFVNRWIPLLVGMDFVEEFSYHFLSLWPLGETGWPSRFAELLWLATLLCLMCTQWYRYRLSNAIERQQIKWAVLGIGALIVAAVVRLVPTMFIPTLTQPGAVYNSLSTPALICVSLAIPLSIGLAILRYRLWDVDVLINKALVYGLLTGTLAAVYAGLIIGLESMVGRFTAQTDQPFLIVISTLAIAALFQPLRSGIQRLIDRRFYRKRYDAAKMLAAFSATLRNEVDLEQLRAQLIAVVNETMQPGHVSLWLRSPKRPTEDQ